MHILEMIFFFSFPLSSSSVLFISSVHFSRLSKGLEDLKWTLILREGTYILPSNSWPQSFSFWDLDAAQMLSARDPWCSWLPSTCCTPLKCTVLQKTSQIAIALSSRHAGPNPVKNWSEHLMSLCNTTNLNLFMLCQAGTAYKVSAFFPWKS